MKRYVNLFSESFQRRQLVRARIRFWGTAILAASGLAILVGGFAWTELRSISISHEWLATQYAPIESLKKEISAFTNRIANLRHRESAALMLSEDQSVMTLLAIVGQAVRTADDEIYVERLLLDQRQQNRPTNDPIPSSAAHVLTMNGVGMNDLAVARFTAALRDAEIFQEVTLESTVPASVGDARFRTFHLECTF